MQCTFSSITTLQLRSPAHLADKDSAYKHWLWSRYVAFVQARSRPLSDVERAQCERNEALGVAPQLVSVLASRTDARAELSRSAAKQQYSEYLRPGALAASGDKMRLISESFGAASGADGLDSAAGRQLRTGVLECVERHSVAGLLPCSESERYVAKKNHLSEIEHCMP
jgi:hypothetical protein